MNSFGKQDGSCWDLICSITSDDVQKVLNAIAGASPYTAVLSVLAGPTQMAYGKPEAFGYAELAWNGPYDPNLNIEVANTANNIEDTFTPLWPGPPKPGWVNVPFHDQVRVRITLYDEDLSNHDAMGTVELNAYDLYDAWVSKSTYPVAVNDQSANQILFVTVSVTTANP